ncbi:formimidoylglutamate deiminase [Pseudofulvimonas gallinarii]|uniref:Formimidoylglutamate deiminase n=1 Tax=Pseudofulvimonas gallinarii TaxID=634155 RepID=A0A4V2UWY2_9GAMM|nr:formimidoylglutamate deiminase [Pseudofulvimonas gallinarii]TCT01388.1 formimidoylglutamate deiminase [Pseudofulvimonas gallinarii]THD15140.1 formimidoylglutamate deiminase [Pseudofulvimonas gallinarii]
MTNRITATHVWLPEGWRNRLAINLLDGRTRALGDLDAAVPAAVEWLLPGVPNLHSHAFQRAMAGHAERRGDPADSFWTWRETMYGFAGRMSPEALFAIASQLYVEMLEAGYTWVCEFHYVHHQSDGTPYAPATAMCDALIEAARSTGIGLTLLPVLYMRGGFDGRPLAPRQRRFGHEVDAYLALLAALQAREHDRLRIGLALHSLRAVPPDAMAAVLESRLATGRPVHIHIAEQIGEVQDCLAVRGARPVEWLLDNAPVDANWCLVHATHLTPAETRAIADSGATVALCPTTEANLGDGLFPLRAYLDHDGAWGIGSDSHISVSPVEELRWLEYGQRLATHHRNIAADDGQPSVGETLLAGALHGGRACGAPVGVIDGAEGTFAGAMADLVSLDGNAPLLAGHGRDSLIDAWLFAGNRNLVDAVWVGGERVVSRGRHRDAEAVAERYRRCLAGLSG